MPSPVIPSFPPEWQPVVDKAAASLRALALDLHAKERFCSDPVLQAYMHKVSQRYVAGQTVGDAVRRVAQIRAAGHRASAEYMGESVHDEALANAETEVFLNLVRALDAAGHDCSISFDLSHLGLLVDEELGYRNARRVIQAAASSGREVMISMENFERTDAIYRLYARLHGDGYANVGITMPARRHRSAQDLARLMEIPGRIRLVKGAFHEPESVSYARNSAELAQAYRSYAATLLRSGHLCSIATHDRSIQHDLTSLIASDGIAPGQYEFESLDGLGTEQVANLRAQGYATREYLVFGAEHFLYVLNRIAEEPVRVYQAITDLLADYTRPA
ncbi:proline dehydrogenase family protein [Pseudoduganella ginsengisoli]|uniref:proline dehydrogenase family protein n=1 Tax=Pseudoduganella ginsengisoli TaxID=1462440 RepID=UPI0035307C63